MQAGGSSAQMWRDGWGRLEFALAIEMKATSSGEILLLGMAFDRLAHNVGAWVSEAL